MSSTPRYATVALPVHFNYKSGASDGLSYSIPEEFDSFATIGVRAIVPLGKRLVTGVIVEITDTPPAGVKAFRPIADILDTEQVFDDKFLQWTKWLASYYLCSWGEVLEAALPQGLRAETKSKVTITEEVTRGLLSTLPKRRGEVLKLIAEFPNGVFISHLTKRTKIGGLYAHIHLLEQGGYVKVESEERIASKPKLQRVARLSEILRNDSGALSNALQSVERSPKQARVLLRLLEQEQLHSDTALTPAELASETGVTVGVITTIANKGFIEFEERAVSFHPKRGEHSNTDDNRIILNNEQRLAEAAISEALNEKKSKTFLLHGITGSGKTEVYISLARKVLSEGGGVLVLVPEISLTPQLIDRFRLRLGNSISVLHSKMSNSARLASWKALACGETRIAIGARSAVFAPVQNLRLIIVDEEHEATYKQFDKTPRYHARDAAIMRSYFLDAVTVLGSATPSLESYHNANQGKFTLLKLQQRANDAKLPPVKIVDLRRPLQSAKKSALSNNISPALKEAIALRLSKKQGIVLLQNRRGFATFLGCSDCGEVVLCPNCSVTMTWHRQSNRMQCHYCGFLQSKPTVCPSCAKDALYLGGLGTERVEEELQAYFPEITIARMDLDTTARRGSFEKILRTFSNGEADVLLGTQMVAKGLDLARVTLVGVINADTSLSLPDFRSAERTFQLLTQVSGRAGRTEELAGEVFVQTMQPKHVAITYAAAHNYEGFYEKELTERREALYPPYVRLILIEFKGTDPKVVAEKAKAFSSLIPVSTPYSIKLGPAEAAIKKLRGEFRFHLLFKNIRSADPSGEKMRVLLATAVEQYQQRFAITTVSTTIDVDVQGVL